MTGLYELEKCGKILHEDSAFKDDKNMNSTYQEADKKGPEDESHNHRRRCRRRDSGREAQKAR